MAETSPEALESLIFEVLRTELLEVGDEFTPESNLVDSGLSSLAVVQLLLAVEEQTGIWVDEAELTPENLATTKTLAACVYEQRG
jgi:acyl carrier protein